MMYWGFKMTVKAFIETMQSYYNQTYNPGTGGIVARYLETWTPPELDHLASLTIKSFSGQYGKLPDIAVFEKLKTDVWEVLRYLPSKNLQIEDKSEYATPEQLEELFACLENCANKFRKD